MNDEEVLLGGMKLTAKEEAEYTYKRELYEVAKQRATDDNEVVGYHMSDEYDKPDRVM